MQKDEFSPHPMPLGLLISPQKFYPPWEILENKSIVKKKKKPFRKGWLFTRQKSKDSTFDCNKLGFNQIMLGLESVNYCKKNIELLESLYSKNHLSSLLCCLFCPSIMSFCTTTVHLYKSEPSRLHPTLHACLLGSARWYQEHIQRYKKHTKVWEKYM